MSLGSNEIKEFGPNASAGAVALLQARAERSESWFEALKRLVGMKATNHLSYDVK